MADSDHGRPQSAAAAGTSGTSRPDPDRVLPAKPLADRDPDRSLEHGAELEAGVMVRALSGVAREDPEPERVRHRLIRVAKQRDPPVGVWLEFVGVARDRLHGQLRIHACSLLGRLGRALTIAG